MVECQKVIFRIMVLLWMPLCSGCLSPVALKHAVLAYDKTVMEISIEQLLLNIGRARHHHPIHFTGVSNIAATFNFQAQAGATPPLGGLNGGADLSPIFGASVSENPTISIIPIEGEEFTQRLLTPLDDIKFHFLLRYGVNLGALLRLVTREVRLIDTVEDTIFLNEPDRHQQYEAFRRYVGHLASLDEQHHLFVGPVVYIRTWQVGMGSQEAFEALEKGYNIEVPSEQPSRADLGQPTQEEKGYDLAVVPESRKVLLTKRLVGRVVLTNYDINSLSREERKNLYLASIKWPKNEIYMDIRQGHPGGDFPFRGTLRLRGFAGILDFLARGIAEAPEYDVALDPRTPPLRNNPPKTIEIMELHADPEDTLFAVPYNGSYYALRETPDGWNREAFRLLYQIFQMTVTDVAKPLVPSITIAK